MLRARGALDAFVKDRGQRIAARYVENESGARLGRPELFRLLADCEAGDVLLVEQVDRLSRLDAAGWKKLRHEIETRGVRVVALDLPTSWSLVTPADEFTERMFAAVNSMMLDVLAAVARKDYDDRRRRQAEGTVKARAAGLYKGRRPNTERHAEIAEDLRAGKPWSLIIKRKRCSRSLLAKIARDVKATETAGGRSSASITMAFDAPLQPGARGRSLVPDQCAKWPGSARVRAYFDKGMRYVSMLTSQTCSRCAHEPDVSMCTA